MQNYPHYRLVKKKNVILHQQIHTVKIMKKLFSILYTLLSLGVSAQETASTTPAKENRTVDYLVVFDNTSEDYVQKNGGEQKFAEDIVNMINLTLKNSKIDYRFRLADTFHLNTQINDISSGMSVVMNDPEVQKIRMQLKADLVTLVSEPYNDGMRGISNHLADRFAAFSSIRAQSAITHYTAAHEAGHILGCCHSRTETDQAPSQHPWAAAWADQNFRTVVSNPLSSEGKQVPIFSGPESVWEENGKKYILGDEKHDNVRMLKEVLPEAVWFGDFLDDSRYYAAEEQIILDSEAQQYLLRIYSNSFFQIEESTALWISKLEEVKTIPMNGFYMQDGVFSFTVDENTTDEDRSTTLRIFGDSDKPDLIVTITQKSKNPPSGIQETQTSLTEGKEIYNLNGTRAAVRKEQLPQGIYIINGKKTIVP